MMKNIIFYLVTGILALIACIFVGTCIAFGNFDMTIAFLKGEPFYISPRLVHLESMDPGAEEVVTFQLKNFTPADISVVGEKSSCSCAFAENIPIKVGPKKTAEVKIRVVLPKYTKEYDQMVLLMIATSKKLKMTPVRVTASIPNPLPKPKEEDSNGGIGEDSPETHSPEQEGSKQESKGKAL